MLLYNYSDFPFSDGALVYERRVRYFNLRKHFFLDQSSQCNVLVDVTKIDNLTHTVVPNLSQNHKESHRNPNHSAKRPSTRYSIQSIQQSLITHSPLYTYTDRDQPHSSRVFSSLTRPSNSIESSLARLQYINIEAPLYTPASSSSPTLQVRGEKCSDSLTV